LGEGRPLGGVMFLGFCCEIVMLLLPAALFSHIMPQVIDLSDRDVGIKEITLKEENKELKIKIIDSLEKAEVQDDEIYDLTRSNVIQKDINQKLHRELNKLREKNQIERSKVSRI
jgi:hypothetical protein